MHLPSDLLTSKLLGVLGWVGLWWSRDIPTKSLYSSKQAFRVFFCLKTCFYGRLPADPLSRFSILPSLVKVSVRLYFQNEPQTHLSNLNKISVQLLPESSLIRATVPWPHTPKHTLLERKLRHPLCCIFEWKRKERKISCSIRKK